MTAAQDAALTLLLDGLEWSSTTEVGGFAWPTCPVCCEVKLRGHKSECRLAEIKAAIAAEQAAEAGGGVSCFACEGLPKAPNDPCAVCGARTHQPPPADRSSAVTIPYTNWRGEFGMRTIVPVRIFYGSNEWHPDPQWLIEAWDFEKSAVRTFALAGIGHSDPDPGKARREALEELLALIGPEEHWHSSGDADLTPYGKGVYAERRAIVGVIRRLIADTAPPTREGARLDGADRGGER